MKREYSGNISSYKVIFGFFILSLAIISVLFRGGNIVGGGEAGAAFYDLSRVYTINRMAWSDIFLGLNSGLTSVSSPTFGFLAFLQTLGVPGYVIQAGFFLMILFLSLYSMYRFTAELFPKASLVAWVFSALFYQFNLFSIANIWNRFLPNVMLFYAVLPLILWLFIRGLRLQKYFYAVLISLLTVVFSYAFSAPAQVLIFWIIILFTSLYYYFLISRNRFVLKFFLVTSFLWTFFNFWWVSQELYFRFSTTFSVASELFFSQTGNLSTFTTLSNLLGKLSNIFLLKHGTFFSTSKNYPFDWPLIFNHPLVAVLSWLLFITVTLFAIRKRRSKWVAFLLTLFVLAVLGSKGNSPPLGEVLGFGFQRVLLLQFFRNPFEKLGMVLALSFSPLVGLAVIEILSLTTGWKTPARTTTAFFLVSFLVFMSFPFWTGLIFTSGNPPANDPTVGIQIEVPKYYQEADQWLSSRPGEFRHITFPLGPGEGIYYQWPKGYVGLEQSSLLFSNSGISHVTTVPYYADIARSLEEIFVKHSGFYKVASLLNVKYLVLRPDIDFKLSGMRDPKSIEDLLKKRALDPPSMLTVDEKFGPLKFYRFSDDVVLPKIYAATGIIKSNANGRLEDMLVAKGGQKDMIFVPPKGEEGTFLSEKESTVVTGNIELFEIDGPQYPKFTEAPYIFPYVRHLPSSRFYQLILLKERVEGIAKIRSEGKVTWEILRLGKRLIEARESLQQKDFGSAMIALNQYKEKFPYVFSQVKLLSASLKRPGERVWREKELFETFNSHLFLLKQFEASSLNDDGYVTELLGRFKKEASNTKVLPFQDLLESDSFPIKNRVIYQLEVKDSGKYEILIPKTKFFPESFDLKGEVLLQIDDQLEKRKLVVRGDLVSFGEATFEEGLHEIGFNQLPVVNLAEHDDFSLQTVSKKEELVIPISDFDPYTQYKISFDYWIRYGDALGFAVNHNTDKPVIGKDREIDYYYSKRLAPDNYWFDLKSFSTVFNPNPSADTANLVFGVSPWNNCEELFVKEKDECRDQVFKKTYDKPTYVSVSNLRVTPKLPRTLFLLSKRENKLAMPEAVTFDKVNPTRYLVSVNGANEPFLLAFSELYDSGWKAYLREEIPVGRRDKIWETWGQSYISDQDHFLVNGYANSWWIDKTGDFEIVLDFFPQRLLYIGYLVSGISSFFGLSYLMFILVKNKFKK